MFHAQITICDALKYTLLHQRSVAELCVLRSGKRFFFVQYVGHGHAAALAAARGRAGGGRSVVGRRYTRRTVNIIISDMVDAS